MRGRLDCGQGREKGIDAYKFILQALGLFLGVAQYFGQARGNIDLVGINASAGNRRSFAQGFFKSHAKSPGRNAHVLQIGRNYALLLLNKGKRQMLAIGFLVPHANGNGLGRTDCLARAFR